MEIWTSVKDIITAPFTQPLDLKSLFVLIGIILVMIAAWVMILHYVELAAAEI